jgi:uncharacterized protein (DUF488 family)
MCIYTIGHSNRSQEEFLELLAEYGIQAVADVRAFPTSRRYPHFSRERLERALAGAGIVYLWLGRELGGYRRQGLGENSPNTAWRAGGFRNYADHMLTPEFQRGIERVLELAQGRKTAIMCAERFWWRCHRRLISDFLVAQGHRVVHILEADRTAEHRLSPFAQVEAGRVIYPARTPSLWED